MDGVDSGREGVLRSWSARRVSVDISGVESARSSSSVLMEPTRKPLSNN